MVYFPGKMKKRYLTVLSRFDSSVGRGDFVTPIGVGRVIKGNISSSFHLQQARDWRLRETLQAGMMES